MINAADLQTMYGNSIVLYKNKPVFIIQIGRGNGVHIFDLFSQRDKVVDWDEELFQAPTRRLGMVNVDANCVYVVRNPVRKYSVGLTNANLSVNCLEGANYTVGYGAILTAVKTLRITGLADCMFNKYPSFKEANGKAREVGGCVAFDKQFAIDRYGNVFYKTRCVGEVAPDAEDVHEIVFAPEHKQLGLLLNDNYTRTIERIT